ncbi:MAG: hypothetical protein HY720_02790 [Planctomycetes bacterium]|nr:hypothetical protein [Planctomycetota bacterium]
MRRLILVPVVHTPADMGSLAGVVSLAYRARCGTGGWQRHRRAVEEMWRGIEARIEWLHLDWRRVKLYQDGLPVCGSEGTIVRDLAEAGSRNHQIVLRLVERGAVLIGTESPELLVEEYALARRQLAGAACPETSERAGNGGDGAASILARRDLFIARRIDETLMEGETGILFVGMLHQVHHLLPQNIAIEFLIHRLPFGAAAEGPRTGRTQ